MFVIFDLDGTLALIEHRRHFVESDKPDWKAFYEACDKDQPNTPVISALKSMVDNHGVEIWSGREDSVLDKTEKWLNEHVGKHVMDGVVLRMRSSGDYTPDDKLKEAWLDEAIDRRHAPSLVFDDRDKVVAMWRRRGIVCAQVAPGAF